MYHLKDELRYEINNSFMNPIIPIIQEEDIVIARTKCRFKAEELGFTVVSQTRLITAVSEIARNIYLYAKPGTIQIFDVHVSGKTGIWVIAEDSGPGITNIDMAMQTGYTTSKGLGMGLSGVKQMMDEFSISSSFDKGTHIEFVKWSQ